MGGTDLSATLAVSATVLVDDAPLTVGDIVAIARGARVELGPAAMRRITASRSVVDGLVAGEALIYGLNTGLGHKRNERVPIEELARRQAETVRVHAGGLGPPLPVEVVRAAMAVRLAGIARGGSGASPAMAVSFASMLNAGVTPVVPTIGSVGASDLMHMASIALVAIGEGSADFGDERLPGGVALERAGIVPLELAPKDGLTIVSANGVSVGHAALVVDRATRLADAADVAAALSLEAASGNLSIVDPAVGLAKGVPGQVRVAERIRRLLAGSRLFDGAPSTQDPLSFRVMPQVHGALREVIAFLRSSVDGELAAMDDNPLVSVPDGRMISNGNFHPMLMTLAVESLRPALAHVGQLSDRRSGHLWDALVSDPEIFAPGARARHGITPLIRYSGAAVSAELRSIATPVSLDVGVLDLGVEDHATNAPLAVRRTDAAIDLLTDLLAIELLVAAASLAWKPAPRGPVGPLMAQVLMGVEQARATAGPGAPSEGIHAAVRELVLGPLTAEPFSVPAPAA